jgi:hypothetical protein
MKIIKRGLIEAVQWDGSVEQADRIELWTKGRTTCFGSFKRDPNRVLHPGDYIVSIQIDENETEDSFVSEGDWIVKQGSQLFKKTDKDFQNEHGQIREESV